AKTFIVGDRRKRASGSRRRVWTRRRNEPRVSGSERMVSSRVLLIRWIREIRASFLFVRRRAAGLFVAKNLFYRLCHRPTNLAYMVLFVVDPGIAEAVRRWLRI